jgi:ribosome assembly protein 4
MSGDQAESSSDVEIRNIIAQFTPEDGEPVGPQLHLPVNISVDQLDEVLNKLMGNDDSQPYSYWIGEEEVTENVAELLLKKQKEAWADNMLKKGKRFKKSDTEKVKLTVPTEEVLKIIFRPQAVFKVRPVTRCTSTLSGHSEAVLVCSFSPDGNQLVTGSGDCTIRVWDLYTETAVKVLKAHTAWVQSISWSPNGERFASGGRDSKVAIWHGKKFERIGNILQGHKDRINEISWEPLHRNLQCNRLATASKDKTVKVWKLTGQGGTRDMQFSLSGHTGGVQCVKWGGMGYIYTCSQDRSLMVWDADQGTMVRRLDGHAHWVNYMALNTDIVLRTGAFDHTDQRFKTPQEAQDYARQRYEKVIQDCKGERLVSCSDDNTMFMWDPCRNNKPITRMTGHMKCVNRVLFSPDGKLIASASFDKSVKLWNAVDGKYVTTLRGHVSDVYMVAWSSDSRLLLSCSKDTTMKCWSMKSKKIAFDLPGHMDEVFACDWSPDGLRVASGGKDKNVKIWRH